jgi:hypothetical protein
VGALVTVEICSTGGAGGWQPLHTVYFELVVLVEIVVVDALFGGDAKQDVSLETSEITLDESDKAVKTVWTGTQAICSVEWLQWRHR